MVRSNAPSKKKNKQQKRGIDFKKIKRKVGRKLPPPNNATNTEIKSKAIILPEQSVASEKVGLAVSKKGLTLKELLQQTSHYSPKVRRDALVGIRDLIVKYPEELKLHKYAVIEKLRERISDEDKVVRETLYQLFKSVVLPRCKEDNQGPLVPLMMTYIFNAMTHLAVDVRLMAVKFVDLIVQNHPPSFALYGDKILQNYENILRKNQFYLQDKGKLKNILAGLVYCLSLLPSKKREVDTLCKRDIASHSVLHALEFNDPTGSAGFSVIFKNLNNILPVLVNCFHEFVPLFPQQLDVQSFDCMLYILQSIDLAVSFFLYGIDNCQPELQASVSHKELPMWCQTLSSSLFKKLWDVFPLNPIHHFTEKDDQRFFILNLVITKIFLQLCEWIFPPVILLEKFIMFIESALAGKMTAALSIKAHYEKHVLSLLPFLPKLVSQTESCWKYRLLQAFTKLFDDCKPGSSLKLACLSTFEEMLLPREGAFILDVCDPDTLGHMISWIRELPLLLIQLGDTNPSFSEAVLHLQLRLGQCALLNSSFLQEYDNLQDSLLGFYSTFSNEGTICYGPFIKLSRESQELAICCLYYFSRLDPLLLKSLASCCLCHDLEPFVIIRIVEVLQSSYKAGHIEIADHISFFITLLARFKILPGKLFPVSNGGKIANRRAFKSLTSVICSCLSQMGDDALVFQIIENIISDQISQKPPLDNTCALLRVLVVLDPRFTRVSEQSIISLSHFLPGYLMDVAYCIPEFEDETSVSVCLRARRYYLIPCFFLFERSHRLLNLVLDTMGSLVLESSSVLQSCGSRQCNTDDSSRIIAIVSILLSMLKDVKLPQALVPCKAAINLILQNILLVQSSEQNSLTIEGRHKLKCAYDRLRVVASTLPTGTQTH